ncbi:UDP-N-acetylglucosamine 1-carboxyvinyltransferase [Microbacterium sp. ru370.1]|uniref:UDP-N-acetylglucosamine 1-carboxyvinyltransferase n=1 Tax=unclassified Microbacterium TaxID=2609290 RepID=UPI00088264F1|nr:MULTISPECIES: UDP-N-acetylglucosamine 1-carboxyvinyltransferase [unclassified Microbacterium]SDO45082.1 UDP-N-acetylglucosamine 1-carboxyvinyltransferase [Microbacterium sp. ru370.1]SIT81224.1 UDP-N-acetylglucosamine 1-carboxyvinyltransferase [Microbacterium sp. RU1D]
MYAVVDGGTAPAGHVRVSGAKNSATRLLAAALLSDETVELGNFPTKLVDVGHKVSFARNVGATVEVDHINEMVAVNAASLTAGVLTRDEYDLPIRTTYLLAAAQLLREGIARIPYPGGCPIGGGTSGSRGYDLHIMVWERMGASVRELEDHIEISAPKGMVGGEINFPSSTVGGTENALLCAAVAQGRSSILNAYITPEVNDLIALLRRMGASITVYGSSHIVVDGRGSALNGARMDVMSDRIEALTWIVYAILSGGNLTIEGVPFESMEVPLIHIEQAGIDLFRNSNSVHVTPECLQSGRVEPFELACGAHPGVISDMQAFYVMLGLVGSGTSRIYDYRYPERIAFVGELAKLVDGDHLAAERGKITVQGPARFIPGVANSTDLRGSMAVVMAALCAPGRSVIQNAQMALRGYNDLEAKLRRLGSQIAVYEDAPTPSQVADLLAARG